ncbi:MULTISPECIES: branched-chain amino acid ABC transporter permease [Cupriavidus]|uniref:branched-chain amino acid ABC transporter permease n=1 Tax=Cupriavidus TaxID=106589 RepID=UPI000370CF15|nr:MULTISPECIES: branched-chain amino acid ABC transporter permease [Cupriavidus]
MQYFLQQIINGIGDGAIYASLGLALVLIYRTTNIANFAQGEMATVSAYVAWQCVAWGLPLGWAIVVAIVVSLFVGMATYLIFVRPVQNKDELTIIIVTLGLFLAFNSLSGATWGFMQMPLDSPFPEKYFSIGSFRVSVELLGTVAVLVAISVGMFLLFQKTRLGMALRAAASNGSSAKLVGIPFTAMMAIGWGLAAVLGAVSGLLVAPRVTIDPNMMGSIIIYAFAAAVVGGLTSYRGAVVGGAVVGISQSLSMAYLPWLGADLQILLPLLLIVAVLIVKPEGLFGSTVMVRV